MSQSRRKLYTITSADDMPTMQARVAAAVRDVFQIAVEQQLLRPEDTGGVLLTGYDGMTQYGDLNPYMTVVGWPKCFTVEECYATALEKFNRLYNRREGEVTAWESRDTSVTPKKWGGAIIADYGQDVAQIMAFSGASEFGDEAMLVIAAQLCGIMDDDQAMEILRWSGNDLYSSISQVVMTSARAQEEAL